MVSFATFDLYALDPRYSDFQEFLFRLKESGAPDVFWTNQNGGHWMATSSAAVREVLSTPTRFSSKSISVPRLDASAPRMPPLQFDPPESEVYRQILADLFSPKSLACAEAAMRNCLRLWFEKSGQTGRCEFVSELAVTIPVAIFSVLTDVGTDERVLLQEVARSLIGCATTTQRGHEECLRDLWLVIDDLRRRRSASAGDDWISTMVSRARSAGRVSPEDVTKLGVVLFSAGLDTMVSTMAATVRHFAMHPAIQRRLREGRVVASNIEELLRRYPVFSPAREAVVETTLSGARIAAGDMIVAPTAYLGFDGPRDPLSVRFDRTDLRHAAFGVGPHRCIGASLARVELRLLLDDWVRSMPDFSLAAGASVTLRVGPVAAISRLELVW